jgi:hypothetical protein
MTRPRPTADNRAMKVFDLQCGLQHGFEGWFASEDDFQSQLGRGLITCPLCGDASVTKMPSAPRLNLGASSAPAATSSDLSSAPAGHVVAPAKSAQALQAAWMKMVRHVLENTDDVGERFAAEARRMHHGEAENRNIRGRASPQEALELMEEGIEVLPLPVPAALNGPLQ